MRKIAFVLAAFCLSFTVAAAQDEPSGANVNQSEQAENASKPNEVSKFLLKKEIYEKNDFSDFAAKLPDYKEKPKADAETPDQGKARKGYEVFVNHNTEWLSNGFGIWRTTDVS
ncbi:MAG: hypothetical protein HKN25_13115, partial [Pyrinomonadaceae bacterium]|nr:hypothetical protein [Pyrinomonadaceae bacterium]